MSEDTEEDIVDEDYVPTNIEFECTCGNPACKQSIFMRKGAVYYADKTKNHWNQGYINVHGLSKGEFPEIMLDPERMIELRDWLNAMYPP